MQKLTLVREERDDECYVREYACDFIAECDGSSIWENSTGKQVRVTGITVIENNSDDYTYTTVNVTHDSNWEIYTDSGFEAAISDALGFNVSFTEQGMQEDNYASMEC